MKHRWIAIAALVATLTLGGCAPGDEGAGESAGAAASDTGAAEPSASATPYTMDDY